MSILSFIFIKKFFCLQQKNSPWEGSVRVPAVIWSPLLKKNRYVTNKLIHITDWLPTLLTGAGIRTKITKKDSSKHHEIDGIDQWNSLSYNTKTKRTELLINIDSVTGASGLIRGKWKYVTKISQPNTDTWLAVANIDSLQADDNVYAKSVLLSETSQAISAIYGKISLKKIVSLTRAAQVHCDPVPDETKNLNRCDPSKGGCLFDLQKDECEYYNVASVYPKTFSLMKSFLEKYKEKMVPSLHKPTDPNCDPKYFNNTWVSWNDYPPHTLQFRYK